MTRLDKLLTQSGLYSRSEARELIRSGRVSVDGETLRRPEVKAAEDAAVFVDGEEVNCSLCRYFMLNKPAGVLSATDDRSQPTVLDLLPREIRALGLFPVGRLDKDTTGLMLLAKDGYTAARLPEFLQKTYWAVCEGKLQGEETISLPIGLEPGSRIRRCTGEQAVNPVPAVTHWKALAGDGSHTLLALTLGTGRTHQIRVHLAAIGCPLAGDDLYGGSRTVISRQALHCREALRRDTGQVFTAPLPRDFREAFPGFFPQEDFLEQFGGEEN